MQDGIWRLEPNMAVQQAKSGDKYNRTIHGVGGTTETAVVDVYSVLVAFDVCCPALQHAIKKLLCAGLRGKGDCHQDLWEARDAVDRAIEMEAQRESNDK